MFSWSVDTYLISASSLFVFDDWVMIKTCGNIKVFETISLILFHSKRDAIGYKIITFKDGTGYTSFLSLGKTQTKALLTILARPNAFTSSESTSGRTLVTYTLPTRPCIVSIHFPVKPSFFKPIWKTEGLNVLVNGLVWVWEPLKLYQRQVPIWILWVFLWISPLRDCFLILCTSIVRVSLIPQRLER